MNIFPVSCSFLCFCNVHIQFVGNTYSSFSVLRPTFDRLLFVMAPQGHQKRSEEDPKDQQNCWAKLEIHLKTSVLVFLTAKEETADWGVEERGRALPQDHFIVPHYKPSSDCGRHGPEEAKWENKMTRTLRRGGYAHTKHDITSKKSCWCHANRIIIKFSK